MSNASLPAHGETEHTRRALKHAYSMPSIGNAGKRSIGLTSITVKNKRGSGRTIQQSEEAASEASHVSLLPVGDTSVSHP